MKLFKGLFKLFSFFAWIASSFVSLLMRGVSNGKEFACILQMLAGAAIMLIPLAYSFFTFLLPKTPAILITFAGAAIGTWLFMKGLRQYRAQLPEEQKATTNQDDKVRQLEKEINRLQNMTLNVSSIQNVLSVSLLEIETNFRDFKKEEIQDTPGGWFTNRIIHEYLGYINEKIRVRYGIDLKKIRIRDEGQKIVVSGIKCEYQGVRESDTVDEHYEIREKKVSENGDETWGYCIVQGEKDSLLLKSHKDHISELKKKLNSGIDLIGLEGASTFVENLGKEFVKNFFFPTGRKVEFVDESTDSGHSLEEFVQNHNLMVENAAKKRNERIKMLEIK